MVHPIYSPFVLLFFYCWSTNEVTSSNMRKLLRMTLAQKQDKITTMVENDLKLVSWIMELDTIGVTI